MGKMAPDAGRRALRRWPRLAAVIPPSIGAAIPAVAAGSSRAFGDALLDVKWRFYKTKPLSWAVRAGVTFPSGTGDSTIANGKPSYRALLVTTVDAAPFTVNADMGYARNASAPALRDDLYHVSAALVYAASGRLLLVANTGVDSNPDPTRSTWPAVLLVGAICALRPGLDVDVGYQVRLNHAAPARQWLLGITYRWAP